MGYVIGTYAAKVKKLAGKNFNLHVGQIIHPEQGPIGKTGFEVGNLVCACLAKHKVGHK